MARILHAPGRAGWAGAVRAIILALVFLTPPASALVTATAPSAILTTSLVPSNGMQTTVEGFAGASVTFTNTLSTSESVVVYATTMNQAGQTAAVSLQGSTIPPGGSLTFFFSAPVGVSGSFDMLIFAATTTDIPLSVSTSVPITV